MTRRARRRSPRCFRILEVRFDCVVAAIRGRPCKVYFETVRR